MDEQNPYVATLQVDQAAAVRQSLQIVLDKPATQEAQLQALAQHYQLPVDAVRQQQTELQRRADLDAVDYQQLVQQLPATRQLLSQPQQAAIAHDDIANLSQLEQVLQGIKNSGKALLSGVYGFSEGLAGQAEAGADLFSHYVTAPLAGTVLPVDIGQPVAQALHQLRKSQTAWREYLSPPAETNVGKGFYAGLQSLTQNLLTLPVALATDNPALALKSMALNTGGQSYGKARDLGLPAPQAAVYAGADAAIEYGTEQLPVGLLFKDLKAGTPFFKLLSRQILSEVPGEQAATALQDFNEWSVLHPEQSLQDYLDARPDAALQTLVATAVGTGGQTSLVHATQALFKQNQQDTSRTAQQSSSLAALQQLAASSKVLARQPETLRNFVQTVLADSPVQHVFINAQALAEADAEQPFLHAIPDVQAQLPAALATDGEVSMPIADYVTQLAPQRYAQQLINHVRLGGEALNRAEALHMPSSQAEQWQAELADLLHEQQSSADSLTDTESVKAKIYSQLQQVSPFADKVHSNYATLLAHYYKVQAQKLGMTAEALYQQYPLQIAGPKQTESAAATNEWLQSPLPEAQQVPSVEPSRTPNPAPPLSHPQAAMPSPTEEAASRGSYQPATRTITLHENADLSTFLHESAHFFLDMQFELSAQVLEQAEPQDQADLQAVLLQKCSECRIPTVNILVRPWPKIGLHRHGLMPAAPWPSTSLEGGTSCSRMTLRALGRPCRFSMKTRPAPVRFQGLFGRHSLSLSFLSKQRAQRPRRTARPLRPVVSGPGI
jgi:hypothetical protein